MKAQSSEATQVGLDRFPSPVARVPEKKLSTQSRIQSVDIARGTVMMLMAIDHTRDFINRAAMSFLPTDLTRTTTALFFTRWITHFCAPMFAFTAGMGAFLWLQRGRTKAQLSWFLVTRGLWLAALDVTVLRFILFSDWRWHNRLIILLVFWMLGICMIALAALIHLPIRALAALSIVMIAGHNLLDSIRPAQFGHAAWLWDILHVPATFHFDGAAVVTPYSLIPWIGVMALGYCFGPVLLWEQARRRRFILRLGVALTVAFVVIRAANIYGDPARWTVQHSAMFTVLSFLNCTKYPPSLLFLLMTLGPGIAAMAWFDRMQLSLNHPLIVFGRVPFFFYVIHLALIHSLAILMGFIRYGAGTYLAFPPPSMGGPAKLFPPNYGYPLWVVYVVWVVVLLMLYPVCRWYARLKRTQRDWWLSYL